MRDIGAGLQTSTAAGATSPARSKRPHRSCARCRRKSRRASASCARWTTGAGSPTPSGRNSSSRWPRRSSPRSRPTKSRQDVGPRRHRARPARAAREVAGGRRSAAPFRAAAVGSLPGRDRFHPQPLRDATSRSCAKSARRTCRRKRRSSRKPKRSRNSSDWSRTAARFQELQTAWQQTGPVPREAGRDLGQRFRAACNTFFARRREDLGRPARRRGPTISPKKEALCAARRRPGRVDRMGRRVRRDEAAAGRMEDRRARCAAASPRWCGPASAPPPIDSSSGTTTGTRSRVAGKLAEREALVVELETLAAVRQRRRPGRPRRARAAAAHDLESQRAHSRRGDEAARRSLADRADADRRPARRRVQGHRSRSGRGPPEDGEAGRAGRGVTSTTCARRRSASRRRRCSPPSCAPRSRRNAMGGRASEDAKWRAAADAVKEAQAAWQRLAQVAGPDARALEARFREACRRVMDHARRQTSAAAAVGRRGRRPSARKQGEQAGRRPRRSARRESKSGKFQLRHRRGPAERSGDPRVPASDADGGTAGAKSPDNTREERAVSELRLGERVLGGQDGCPYKTEQDAPQGRLCPARSSRKEGRRP